LDHKTPVRTTEGAGVVIDFDGGGGGGGDDGTYSSLWSNVLMSQGSTMQEAGQ